MAVDLVKADAKIVVGLANSVAITCSRCSQAYKLHYSDGESHRLKEWQANAQAAVNKSHPDHKLDTLSPLMQRVGQ